MGQDGPIDTSSPYGDISRMVKHNHMQILALFQVYRVSPPDTRQAIQDQILRQLASHLDKGKELLFQEIRRLGPLGRKLVVEAEVENEEIKAMILELQHSEGDDDQERDEFFEDMMQSARVLFMTEERDLLPLVDRSKQT
jgi:hypothetical protein